METDESGAELWRRHFEQRGIQVIVRPAIRCRDCGAAGKPHQYGRGRARVSFVRYFQCQVCKAKIAVIDKR